MGICVCICVGFCVLYVCLWVCTSANMFLVVLGVMVFRVCSMVCALPASASGCPSPTAQTGPRSLALPQSSLLTKGISECHSGSTSSVPTGISVPSAYPNSELLNKIPRNEFNHGSERSVQWKLFHVTVQMNLLEKDSDSDTSQRQSSMCCNLVERLKSRWT